MNAARLFVGGEEGDEMLMLVGAEPLQDLNLASPLGFVGRIESLESETALLLGLEPIIYGL